MRPKRILLVWLLLVFFQPSAWGTEIYTWVDAKKVTHFSQFPPTGQSASKIPLDYQPAKSTTEAKAQMEALRKELPSAAPGVVQASDSSVETTKAPKQTLQQTKEEKAAIALRCEKAKQELAFLQTPSTPEVTDSAGNPRLLTQTEKKQRLQAAAAQIEMYCD